MSFPGFDADLVSDTLSLFSHDGRSVTLPLPRGLFPSDTNIERVAVRPGAREALIGLPGGVEAAVELRADRPPSYDFRRGRKVVYLDQNHWSTIAAAQQGNPRVSERDAVAAKEILAQVTAGTVVLAASAGHFVETGPLYGAPRLALASTVLSLSRGWQMRNPLHVRRDELRFGLERRLPVAENVFAPNADELFASSQNADRAYGLPAPLAEIASELVGVLGLYDALVDREAIPDEGGEAAAASWAEAFRDLSEQLRTHGAGRDMVRRVSHARLILDVYDELLPLGDSLRLSADEVVDRLTTPDDPIAAMPFLSRVRAVLFARLRNVGQSWEANDLFDIMFLCCATGYADVVVGERRSVGYLRQARNVSPGANLASTLEEGVAALANCS
jgi:hypothetical protein